MDMRVAADASGSEDQPWTLPEGWCWAAIGDIARLRGEKVNPSDAPQLPFVGMDDIPNDGLRVLNTKPFAQMKSAGNKFEPGDVLYGRLRPYLNKTAIASAEGAASGELLAIKTEIDANYFQFFLHSQGFINRAMATVSGDRPRIDFSTIAEFKFPLAPLPEQRRIVERIESLFAEIAEGEAALEDARKGLETFRRALLKSAVTGELTRDWRENNQPNETGHDLLARIKAEHNPTSAKGRGKRAASSPRLDVLDLPELPNGWAWARVDDLVDFVTSGSRGWSEYYADSGVMFVRAQNINSGALNLSKVAYVRLPTNAEGTRTRLRRGDVLVTITGANVTVSALVDHEIPEAYINQHIALLRPTLTEMSNFLLLWLQAEGAGKTQLMAAAYGAGKPGLNLDNIREVYVAIPPLEEASELARRVAEALETYRSAFSFLEDQRFDAARLRQAILKSAFEGTLMPQDPSDEPASVMLKRLKDSQINKRKQTKRGKKV